MKNRLTAEEIIHAAREKSDPAERAGFLDAACGNDVSLRAKVEALLNADANAGKFLRESTRGQGHDVAQGSDLGATISRSGRFADMSGLCSGGCLECSGRCSFGRYKLLQQIGEGAFGVVYVAEQCEPVQRRVALKVIRLGMDTRQVTARFDAERQALAMMDHPNIAKVLDAGSTETGRPYFVMEYIKGVPIVEYCDTEKLDTKQRLDLVTKVCDAIQHAHQKGIIHRDIKPSNVLITLLDGVPVPKVIDFGVAKATSAELTTRTLFTERRQMIGTPAYMSPEQAEMSGLDIDTRSDIYSLGVLLYELLTGTKPFDLAELLSKGYAEMMRTIREVEPQKPSSRLSTLGNTGTHTAQQRCAVDPKKLSQALRGDLDWIVMKCLEKNRTRRYDTANDLAMDIRRHLAGQAVLAAPPSAAYRLRKFVRRNRAVVITASLVGLLLVAGTIGTTRGLILTARSNADLKRSHAAVQERYELAVDAVKTFHTGVSQDFLLQQDQFKELRDGLLGAASSFYEKLGGLLKDEADVPSRRSLLRANFEVAALTNMVGRREDALALHRRVLQGREELAALPGANPEMALDVAQSLLAVGEMLEQTGQTDEALAMFERARSSVAARNGGPPQGPAAQSVFAEAEERAGLLFNKIGRTDEALRAIERAGALLKTIAAADPEDTEEQLALASSRHALATLLKTAKPAEALVVFEEVRAIRQKLADAHPDVPRFQRELSQSHRSIGAALYAAGNANEALKAFDKALPIAQKLADANPAVIQLQFDLVDILQYIGHVHRTSGRLAEALDDETRAFTIISKLVEAHPTVTKFQAHLAGSYNNIGWVLSLMGKSAEALEAQAKALAIRQMMADANASMTQYQADLVWCHDRIGDLLLHARRPGEALSSFEAARTILTKLADAHLADPSPPNELQADVANSHMNVADALRAMGRRAEARAGYKAAIAMCEALVREHPTSARYRSGLARSLRRLGLTRLAEGDAAGAAADTKRALELLESVAKPRPDDWFEMACCHAVLSTLAGHEGSGVRVAEGPLEAQKAMALLTTTVGMREHEPATYRTEPALDPLRSRDDFVRLMAEIEE